MTRRVLLTGGAGFIGSALAAALAKRGDAVTVLDKLTYAGHKQNLAWIPAQGWPGSVELIVGDITDPRLVATLFKQHGFDTIIHAAAESHVDNSIAGSAPFILTNVVGTHVLLEVAREYWATLDGARKVAFRFLQVSTDEVYGALPDDGAFTTATPLAPNSPYAASKASADLLVRAWHKTYGLPTLITRCCNNYGPRQHPEKLIPRMITNALAGEKLPVYGEGKQIREWIHVDDHAQGVIATLERGTPGEVYHLGSGEERRNLALVETLCDLLTIAKPGRDYRALVSYVPDRLGHDYRYALDVAASGKAIGWKPAIAFTPGLRDTVNWYLANEEWIARMLEHTSQRREA